MKALFFSFFVVMFIVHFELVVSTSDTNPSKSFIGLKL